MIPRKKKTCKVCGREDYIFSKGRCKPCAQKAYANNAQTTPQPPTKIKPISDKQAARLREYRKVRDEFMKTHSVCQVDGCKNIPTDVHHMRGKIGDLLTDVNFFLAVCRGCHTRIETNPEWAKENGYSLNRL